MCWIVLLEIRSGRTKQRLFEDGDARTIIIKSYATAAATSVRNYFEIFFFFLVHLILFFFSIFF